MNIRYFFFLCIMAFLFLSTISSAASEKTLFITMSTTTSTQASGLLDVLLPAYYKDTGVRVKVLAKGTGAAIQDGLEGNVDIILVHAKSREEEFVRQGFGTKRYAIMHNDFVILGPTSDPAGVRNCKNAVEAFDKIAKSSMKFVSRGDDSGTHIKEQKLWKATGLDLDTHTITVMKEGEKTKLKFTNPAGDFYISIGQGMGKALTFADEKQVYILSDRGTYIKYRYGKKPAIELVILHQGDPRLHNPYGIIPVNPVKHPHVKHKLADSFARWLTTFNAQALINEYKLHGEQLFYPDAKP